MIGTGFTGDGIIGKESFSSIGERSSIPALATGADIWEGLEDSIPVPPNIGEQMTVFSTSAEDGDGTNTGVLTARIEYLDGNGLQQTEDITLTGTTPKDTIATDISFINDFYALTLGSNGVAVGIIRIHKKGTILTVYNLIDAGGNKSLTSNRKIPSNKTMYITSWVTSESTDKEASFRLRATCTPDGKELVEGFLFKRTKKLKGTSPFEIINPPIRICSGSLLKVSAWTTGSPGAGSAAFNGYLELNR